MWQFFFFVIPAWDWRESGFLSPCWREIQVVEVFIAT
jgi:hypothetical protein